MNRRKAIGFILAGLLLSALTVLFLWGCTDQPIYEPHACIEAEPTIGYVPLTVTFDASCSSAAGMSPAPEGEYYYVWDFDDANLGDRAGTIVEHTFTEPGTYLVQVGMITMGPGGVPVDGAVRTITVLPTE